MALALALSQQETGERTSATGCFDAGKGLWRDGIPSPALRDRDPMPGSLSNPMSRGGASAALEAHKPMGRANGFAELVILQAQSLNAAEEAIAIVRGNGTVVLNCSGMPQALAHRTRDVVHGGLCAIDGLIEPIGTQVLLLRPSLSRLHTEFSGAATAPAVVAVAGAGGSEQDRKGRRSGGHRRDK